MKALDEMLLDFVICTLHFNGTVNDMLLTSRMIFCESSWMIYVNIWPTFGQFNHGKVK